MVRFVQKTKTIQQIEHFQFTILFPSLHRQMSRLLNIRNIKYNVRTDMNFYTHDELTTAIILVYQKFGRGQLQVVVSFYCTRIVQVRQGAIIPADFPRSISLS